MSLRRRLATAVLCLSLLCCSQGPQVPPATRSSASFADYPTTPAAAAQKKQAGGQWSNCDIRLYYNKLVSSIPAAVAGLKQTGKSAAAQARAAFDIRHNARLTCRAMMASAAEVDVLRARDQAKYGNPDGPTFEQLVQKNQARGLQGDAVYDEITASAQRTDEGVNRACGVHR